MAKKKQLKVPLGRMISYGALALVLVLWMALMMFRYFGLPDQIGERLAQELYRRGISLQFERLYLDPLLRVVARDVMVSQQGPETVNELTFKRLRFEFNWISWWRGDPFLERASLNGGSLIFPLDEETQISVREVRADVRIGDREFFLEDVQGQILNLQLRAKGAIVLRGYEAPPPKPPSKDQNAQRARLWRQIEAVAAEFTGDTPLMIDVEGKLPLSEMEQAELKVDITGTDQIFRGVYCDEVFIETEYRDQRTRLEGELEFLRGALEFEGRWNPSEPKAEIAFYSDVDFSLLAPAAPAPFDKFLQDVNFSELPENQGKIRFDWSGKFKFHLITRSSWENFSVQGVPFKRLYFPLSFDGKRLMVSQLEMENASGKATFDFFFDGDNEVKGRLSSTLIPTSLQNLFGPGLQPFFNSLGFEGKGPVVDCRIEGTALDVEKIKLTGKLDVGDFSYKGVDLKHVKTSFTFSEYALHLPDLVVAREEGQGSGDVWHNVKTREVVLKGIQSELDLRKAARIIGNKMEEYASPYMFFEAPIATAEGKIFLEEPQKNDLKVTIESKLGMEYKFLGKIVTLSNLDADLTFKGETLQIVPHQPVGFFDGTLTGELSLELTSETPYQAKLAMKECDFGKLMNTFFGNEEVSGALDVDATLRGKLSDLGSMNGEGELIIIDGVLYEIPVFGTFSDVLNNLSDGLGYSKADKAESDFKIEDGVVNMTKIDVYSTAFALIGNGTYDMVKDDVNMNMRVNMRGVLGIPLFLVSKLFEYRGTGSLNDTKWEPKTFN
ncbi:MAG: AsmA-like C-terminal region-containing protein [Verrucomicrobiota bacterium]